MFLVGTTKKISKSQALNIVKKRWKSFMPFNLILKVNYFSLISLSFIQIIF